MKQLLTLLLCCTIFSAAKSQISPLQTEEYCPGIEYTFTATITNTYSSMIGVGGCIVTVLPQSPVGTTFTFKGKFADANQKQIFRITFTDNTTKDFDFKKIKSLFYGTLPCNSIQPTPLLITAPRCQITSIPLSFPNLQYSTNFESPSICFGTITNYEYLLPANWKIGLFTSTGNNWISGGNNVTLISDLATGDAGIVRIRSVNTQCGTGLAVGEEKVINVIRPAPSLTITTAQPYICNTNGTTSFTLNGIPTGASVLWTLPTANTNAQINGCNNCPSVTIQRISNANTSVLVTATITHCTYTYTREVLLTLGKGAERVDFLNYGTYCEYTSRWTPYFYGICKEIPNAISYDWYAKDLTLSTNTYQYKGSDYSTDFPLRQGNRNYSIRLIVTTPCGNLINEITVFAPNCINGGNRILISPNPVLNTMNLVLSNDNITNNKISLVISEVIIIDKLGNTVMNKKYLIQSKENLIDVSRLKPDIYFIKVWDGKSWTNSQFIKE